MLNTIGPVWDANEVWLITAAAPRNVAGHLPSMYATVLKFAGAGRRSANPVWMYLGVLP